MDSRPSSRFLRYFVGLATVCLSGWLAGQVAKTDAVGLALTVTQPASPPTGEVIGTPSPRNANYSIDVRLDPDRRHIGVIALRRLLDRVVRGPRYRGEAR